ncbi:MAG TPA: phosphotransferase, partial [Devosia sp.]|nr:phosphotransferase [Devosia sp.]
MATQPHYKAAHVQIDQRQLNAALEAFGLGTLAAVTELHGGAARSFRIDRVGDVPLVLKVFDDVVPDATAKETFAAKLLHDADVPHTRFLAVDDTRSRLPFRFTLANYLPGERLVLFKNEPDVSDLYRQMGA